jgi:hypothetical protein
VSQPDVVSGEEEEARKYTFWERKSHGRTEGHAITGKQRASFSYKVPGLHSLVLLSRAVKIEDIRIVA